MRLPLVEIDREEYCMIDSLTEDRNNQLLGELPRCPTELIKSAFEQMKACQGELTRFAKLADDKLGAHSPDLTSNSGSNLGTAVEKCMDFLRNIAKLRGVMLEASADEPDNAPQAQTPTGVGAKNNTTGQVGGSREQLYAQIQSIAQALKRIEPHSPIPYLLERCVRLGQLPFPELMREVIQESSTLDELDRLIGVKREE
jgi:type VI secretion system protein ImpA